MIIQSARHFDSGIIAFGQPNSGPIPVTDTVNWTRIVQLSTKPRNGLIGFQIAVLGAFVKLRISGAVTNDSPLEPIIENFSTLPFAVSTGSSVESPGPGDVLTLRVDAEGFEQLAVEALAVAAPSQGAGSVTGPAAVSVVGGST